MEGVVNNSVGYDAGGVGSGVGAAILPTGNLTEINRDWNRQNAQDAKDADEAEQKRVVNAKALISDLNPNVAGALDSDMYAINQKKQNLLGQEANLMKQYQGNPTSPDALLQHQYLKAQKDALEGEAQQSAQHKALLLKETNDLETDKGAGEGKYDYEASANKIAQLRSQPSIADRQKLIDQWGGSALVQRDPSLLAQMEKHKKLGTIAPDTAISTETLPSGQQVTKYNTSYDPQKLGGGGAVMYSSDPLYQKAAKKEYAQAVANDPQQASVYQDLAQRQADAEVSQGMPKRIIAPEEAYATSKLPQVFNQTKENQKYIPPSLSDREKSQLKLYYAKYGIQHQDDFLRLNNYANVQNGVAKVFNPIPTIQPDGTKEYKTDALTGETQGLAHEFAGKDANDNPVYKSMPNTIRGAKHVVLPDGSGQTLHVTSQSLIDAGLDPTATENPVINPAHWVEEAKDADGNVVEAHMEPAKVIKEGYGNHPEAWIPMNNGTATSYAALNKLKGGQQFLQGANAYSGNVAQFNKASKPTAETLVEQNAKNKVPVVTTPTGQTVQQPTAVAPKVTTNSTLNNALAAFKTQFNRDPTPKELEKITAKYGK